MKLLVTGFEPFGGETVNPASEALRLLPEEAFGARIARAVIPVTYAGSVAVALAAIERERADAVLMLGQAGGSDALAVERVAINLDDADAPDNAGEVRADVPIIPGGPDARFATLPVKAAVAAIRAAGVPAAVSNTAGTFVCNHLMYGVLDALAGRSPKILAGFIHLPFLPEQAASRGKAARGMALEEMARGVMAAAEVTAKAVEGAL